MVEPRFRWTFADEPSPVGSGHLGRRGARHLGAPGGPARRPRGGDRRGPHRLVRRSARGPARPGRRCPTRRSCWSGCVRARDRGERVLVFGDFDADGLTGLAIMTLALRRFGVAVEPYVPSRLDEGHGLSMAALDAAVAAGASLIVTVDCGTTSVAEVAESNAARHRRDHHRPPSRPAGAARRRSPSSTRTGPTRPTRTAAWRGAASPSRSPSSCSPTSRAGPPRRSTSRTSPRSARSPTSRRSSARTGRSRGSGLERMRRAPRPGIAALLERARIAPAAVDLETVSFAIAPRLNAAGRVGEALEAARLLLADDPAEAAAHADALEAANLTRRDLMKTAVAEARAAVADGSGERGHGRPRPVERRDRRAGGGSPRRGPRASGRRRSRSRRRRPGVVPERRIARPGRDAGALRRPVHPLRWPCRRGRLRAPDRALGRVPGTVPRPRRRVGAARSARRRSRSTSRSPRSTSTTRSIRELAGLAPCGPGNADPLVAVLGLTVTRVRAATGGHSQLTLRRGLDVLDGIAFGRPDIAEVVREGDRLDVVARLTSRTFGGFESLQLDIRDVATSGSHPRTAAVLAARRRDPARRDARRDPAATRRGPPRAPITPGLPRAAGWRPSCRSSGC